MFSFLEKSPSAALILERLKKDINVFAEPVPGPFKGTLFSYLACKTDKNVIVVAPSGDMYRLYSEMRSITEIKAPGKEVLVYPEDDSLIYTRIKSSAGISKTRSLVYRKSFESGSRIIITDINALMEKITGPKEVSEKIIKLRKGMKIKQEKLGETLSESGYQRCLKTEKVFDYSIRGGIVDIFSPDFDYPVRVEFFGDEVESLRFYSQDTYNTTKETDELVLFLFNPGEKTGKKTSSLMDFFSPENTVFFIDDMDAVKKEIMEKTEKIEKYILESESLEKIYGLRTVLAKMAPYTKLKTYSVEKNRGAVKIRARLNPVFKRNIESFYSYIVKEAREKRNVIIVSDNEGETEHLKDIIRERNAETDGRTAQVREYINGDIEKGYVFPEGSLTVISNREIFERYKGKVLGRLKDGNLRRIKHAVELEKNDPVVHKEHGIGVFEGIKNLTVDEKAGDFILIRYAGDDKLYIPIDRINLIDKYVGSEKLPSLSKLGTDFWKRTKKDIEKQLEKMAAELLEIYAKRKTSEGIRFRTYGHAAESFENAFIYEETPDQAKAIEAVKSDMSGPKQMDRLICGDAGFGKTEVAMRAAFFAVQDGYQAIIMTATTLLAQQHFNNFRERMADYPIKIEMLSRLVPEAERKKALEGAADGTADIIIGTHSILGSKVKPANPGIVIIDEEQHFGVKSKEELRKKYPRADLLTLTATPIPRTLYFSLSGIRDISVINTPPPGKRAIETFIVNERLSVVKEIILREILRRGQVFYVHNNVKNINRVKEVLEENLPEVKFRTAHGKMKKSTLENIMSDFLKKKFDVLITTTIIESGLDMPDVNTIIISNAENFGLTQLYQLRGRVGRRDRQAFAYLMVKDVSGLSDMQRERLKTIESYADPGAGFMIAMKDLELRGTGSVIGVRQHGNMEKIGFEMYCGMLEEAVAKLEDREITVQKDTGITVNFKAFIPDSYIWDTAEKITVYKKLFAARAFEDVDSVEKSLKDIWGPVPEEVENILLTAKLKVFGKRIQADEIIIRDNQFLILWEDDEDFNRKGIMRMLKNIKGASVKQRRVEMKILSRKHLADLLLEAGADMPAAV